MQATEERMDCYNESSGESLPPNATHDQGTHAEEVPLFVTYLNMALILMLTVIVIYPAVIVINVIWKTRELHTKYYFFVANLLATDICAVIVRSVKRYLIAILYLLDLHSNSFEVIIRFLATPIFTLFHLMTILLPITLAVERMIVIGFPYRHRSIMATKTVIGILAVMWVVSIILTIIITIIVPVDMVWPFAAFNYHKNILPFFVIPRLISAAFITAANVFLQYKVFESNRKAKENERLGNEEEVKRFTKLAQLLRGQAKSTLTLVLLGGIDVIGNVLISFLYAVIRLAVEPSKSIYLKYFLAHPLVIFLLASHPLIYGLYMKKIRNRLPDCTVFQGQWNTRHSRVIPLHQHS